MALPIRNIYSRRNFSLNFLGFARCGGSFFSIIGRSNGKIWTKNRSDLEWNRYCRWNNILRCWSKHSACLELQTNPYPEVKKITAKYIILNWRFQTEWTFKSQNMLPVLTVLQCSTAIAIRSVLSDYWLDLDKVSVPAKAGSCKSSVWKKTEKRRARSEVLS